METEPDSPRRKDILTLEDGEGMSVISTVVPPWAVTSGEMVLISFHSSFESTDTTSADPAATELARYQKLSERMPVRAPW